jgi:hypothetical protein
MLDPDGPLSNERSYDHERRPPLAILGDFTVDRVEFPGFGGHRIA